MAADVENIGVEHREKAVKTVSKHVEDALTLQYALSKTEDTMTQVLQCGRAKGIYITSMYLLIKALYIVNVLGQFFLLNAFLGQTNHFWGVEILDNLFNGREWESSGHFPRVTLCDFQVRVLGNLHRYTIQCVLMINMFNEKIFLFLWWWFVLVIVANISSFIYWCYIMMPYSKKEAFINRYLKVSLEEANSMRNSDNLYNFITYGLRPDGVFMLRLLAINAGELITTEIMDELWGIFLEKMKTNPFYRAHIGRRNFGNLTISRPLDPATTKLLIDMQKTAPEPGYMEHVYTPSSPKKRSTNGSSDHSPA